MVIFIHHPSRGLGVDGQPCLPESLSKNKAVGFDEGVRQESASLGRMLLLRAASVQASVCTTELLCHLWLKVWSLHGILNTLPKEAEEARNGWGGKCGWGVGLPYSHLGQLCHCDSPPWFWSLLQIIMLSVKVTAANPKTLDRPPCIPATQYLVQLNHPADAHSG